MLEPEVITLALPVLAEAKGRERRYAGPTADSRYVVQAC